MQPHQFQELLDKYGRGACSPEEEQLIDKWYDDIGGLEYATLRDEEKAAAAENIWSAINPVYSGKRDSIKWLMRAAVISLPLLAFAAFLGNRLTVSSTIPQPLEQAQTAQAPDRFINDTEFPRYVVLSDGSEVLLQPFSEIEIIENFGRSAREVQLKGEAFFDVKRNPELPFVVYSNEVVTKVLGTSFNVRAYEKDQEITVAVKTGKVSVYAGKRKVSGAEQAGAYEEVILTPNQKMVYHRKIDKVWKKLVEKPEIIIPDSDLFRMQFENAEISKIFDVLEENYGVEIRFDKTVLNNCRLTTSMSDEGLYDRIEVICKAIGASYSIDDDAVITIHSDGC
jgi:transmembrane sensor